MPSIALLAQGASLTVKNGASHAHIPGIIRMNTPSVRTEQVDVTDHDSAGGFREYIAGFKDAENVTCEMNFVVGNTVHDFLQTSAVAGSVLEWKQSVKGTGKTVCTFNGYVESLQVNVNAGEAQRANMVIKVTGLPVWDED